VCWSLTKEVSQVALNSHLGDFARTENRPSSTDGFRDSTVTGEPDEAAQVESRIAADLAARIGRGDHKAEEEMCRRYARGLVYLIRRRTGDKQLAEDICQSTLLMALERLRSSGIESPDRLAAYLRGIAINLFIGDHRKIVRRATDSNSDLVEQCIDDTKGPMDEVSSDQIRRAVRQMLDELSVARDREILISVYLRDEDKESICQRHGIDTAHFNRVLFRARKRFRELIERKGNLGLVDQVR